MKTTANSKKAIFLLIVLVTQGCANTQKSLSQVQNEITNSITSGARSLIKPENFRSPFETQISSTPNSSPPLDSNAASAGSTAPQKGTVTYQGTYAGSSITKSGGRSNSTELGGALTIEVTFDGAAVDAMFKTTGSMPPFRANGLRNGDGCKLYVQTYYVIEGNCSEKLFNGNVATTATNRQASRVEFSTNVVKINDEAKRKMDADLARQKKEQIDNDEKSRQEKILNSLPSAKK